MGKKTGCTALVFFVCSIIGAHAANVSVPRLELVSVGSTQTGRFVISTSGDVQVRLEGGAKFGAQVGFGVQSSAIETGVGAEVLELLSAAATLRDLFDSPLELSWFVGRSDAFAFGDSFARIFGTQSAEPRLSGFRYFQRETPFEGIHRIDGTGLSLRLPLIESGLDAYAYVYQDAVLGPGVFSADLRPIMQLGDLLLEPFVGASFPFGTAGLYRGGLLLFYDTGEGGAFLVSAGLPYFLPPVTDFGLTDFFLLFEPRVRLGPLGIVLTVFRYPEFYLFEPVADAGLLDINLALELGRPESEIRAGVESRLKIEEETGGEVSLTLSPFLKPFAGGVLWDVRANLTLIPLDIQTLFGLSISIETEF
jgi:hypothetical protein